MQLSLSWAIVTWDGLQLNWANENFLKILQLVYLLSQLGKKKKGYKTKHLNEKPILIGI